MIKKLLKKFIPATYSKIEADNLKLYNELEAKLQELQLDIGKTSKQLKECLANDNQNTNLRLSDLLTQLREKDNEIIQLSNQLQEGLKTISRRLNDYEAGSEKRLSHKLEPVILAEKRIENSLNSIDHKFLYNNDYERKVIQTFYEAYEQEDYEEKFLRLINGLDDEAISSIVTILQRQQLIKGHEGQRQDIFSHEEQEKLKEMQRQLKLEVYRVSDHLFCYKHYFLPVKHFEASVFVYKHGIDCISDLESLKNKDILDVGGFIGDSILILKPLTKQRVFSFEPVRENFEIMKQTVRLNHLENVITENIALGSFVGEKEIIKAGSSSSFADSIVAQTYGAEIVQVNTLDHYLEGKDVNVGLIKVDVEGDEQAFLAGARKTIERFRPILLLSIYHNADDFFNIKPIIESWNLGYKFKIHKPVDYSISREVLLIAEVR